MADTRTDVLQIAETAVRFAKNGGEPVKLAGLARELTAQFPTHGMSEEELLAELSRIAGAVGATIAQDR